MTAPVPRRRPQPIRRAPMKCVAWKGVHSEVESLTLPEVMQSRVRHVEEALNETQIGEGKHRTASGYERAQVHMPLEENATKRRAQFRIAESNLSFLKLPGRRNRPLPGSGKR